MKVTRDNLVKIEDDPLELFYQGFKSDITRISYTNKLRKILCDYLEDVLEGSFENRASQMVYKAKENPQEALRILLSLSKMLRERTEKDSSDKEYLNPSSFNNFFKPIKKMLDMNGVSVVWKRIYATYPEQNNLGDTRGYMRQEIHDMLQFCNAIDKAIILAAASSGARVGGLGGLKWEDVMPVYRIDDRLTLDITESEVSRSEIVCAILMVYRHTRDEYPAFITPEAYNAILNYRTSWISEIGKEPKPNEPLFKKVGPFVRQLHGDGIRKRVERIIEKSGLINILFKSRRHNVPAMNGFRRFFNKVNKETLSKDSPLAALIKKEFQMGHIGLVQLDRNYFKTHIMELIEEYLNAVPNLTISNEEREKVENMKLRKRTSELEEKIAEIEDLKRRMRIMEKTRSKEDADKIEELERRIMMLEKTDS
ncbi:MAG: site-specific integrase [Thaumarchaeota archaeon]|nr:site-specific integrase [Nitrososphaerota archaeon]